MKIDGLLQGIPANLTQTADLLSRLHVGDVIRAQILDITVNEVLLKLLDGATFTASTTTPLDTDKKEFTNFLVKEMTDHKLVLEPIKKQVQPSPEGELKKQLEKMGLDADTAHMEIAREIKAQGLVLHKGLLENVLKLLDTYTQLEQSKAVFLAANKPNPQAADITTLERILQPRQQISNDLRQLVQLLGEEPPKQAVGEGLPVRVTDKGVLARPAAAQEVVVHEEVSMFLTKGEQDTSLTAAGKPILAGKPQESAMASVSAEINQETLLTAGEKVQGQKETVEQERENHYGKARSTAENVKDISGTADDKQELQLQSKRETLRQQVSKLFLDLDTLREDGTEIQPSAMYKKIAAAVAEIRSNLDTLPAALQQNIREVLDRVDNTVRFFNDISQQSLFLQIPILVNGRESTADLYVYRRKSGNRKGANDGFSVFLSLDTAYMGALDSFVSFENRNIQIQYRAADERVISLLKEHYKELYASLLEKGYKLVDVKYKMQEEEMDIMHAAGYMQQAFENRKNIDYRI